MYLRITFTLSFVAILETGAFLANFKEVMMALITIGTIIGTWATLGRHGFPML